MAQIKLTGWRAGLNKVGLTKAFQAELGLSLSEAKRATDRVLAGDAVGLSVDDDAAERVAGLVASLGTDVAIHPRPAVAPKAAG